MDGAPRPPTVIVGSSHARLAQRGPKYAVRSRDRYRGADEVTAVYHLAPRPKRRRATIAAVLAAVAGLSVIALSLAL